MAARAAATKAAKVEPRIHVFDFDPRIPLFLRQQPAAPAPAPTPTPEKDDTVNAGPLCRRLFAIMRALEDLQGQAKRLARWRARPVAERRPQLTTPSASVGRRDFVSDKPMRSMRSWPNATGSPAMCRRSTRREGLRSLRSELRHRCRPGKRLPRA